MQQVPLETLRGQIDAVLEDIGADVVKTGMLPTREVRLVMPMFCKCRSCLLPKGTPSSKL